jgi:hypothetical protein
MLTPNGAKAQPDDIVLEITPAAGQAPESVRVVVRFGEHDENRGLVIRVESPQFLRSIRIQRAA